MKLSQLSFTNFRGFDSFTLPLSTTRPTVITGPNGAGKSSVLLGLEVLLTGNNPVTDKTSLVGLEKRGSTRSEITAVTEQLGEVTRILKPTHSLCLEGGQDLKTTAAQARLVQDGSAADRRSEHRGLA